MLDGLLFPLLGVIKVGVVVGGPSPQFPYAAFSASLLLLPVTGRQRPGTAVRDDDGDQVAASGPANELVLAGPRLLIANRRRLLQIERTARSGRDALSPSAGGPAPP